MISYSARKYHDLNGSERELWRSESMIRNQGLAEHYFFRPAFNRDGQCNVSLLSTLLKKHVGSAMDTEFGNPRIVLKWLHTLGLNKDALIDIFDVYLSSLDKKSTDYADAWIFTSYTFLHGGVIDYLPALWKKHGIHICEVLNLFTRGSDDHQHIANNMLYSPFVWGSIFEHDRENFVKAAFHAYEKNSTRDSRLIKSLLKMPVSWGNFDSPEIQQLHNVFTNLQNESLEDVDYTSIGSLRFVQMHDGTISGMPEEEFYFDVSRLSEYVWLMYRSDHERVKQSFINMTMTQLQDPEVHFNNIYNLLAETMIARWSADPSQRSPLGETLSDPSCLAQWAARILYVYALEPIRWYRFLSEITVSEISDFPFPLDDFEPMTWIVSLAKNINPDVTLERVENELNLAKSLDVQHTGVWLLTALNNTSDISLTTLEIPELCK